MVTVQGMVTAYGLLTFQEMDVHVTDRGPERSLFNIYYCFSLVTLQPIRALKKIQTLTPEASNQASNHKPTHYI